MGGGDGRGTRYRELAAKARADAENITVPQAKQILLEVAASYERLADTSTRTPTVPGPEFQNWSPLQIADGRFGTGRSEIPQKTGQLTVAFSVLQIGGLLNPFEPAPRVE